MTACHSGLSHFAGLANSQSWTLRRQASECRVQPDDAVGKLLGRGEPVQDPDAAGVLLQPSGVVGQAFRIRVAIEEDAIAQGNEGFVVSKPRQRVVQRPRLPVLFTARLPFAIAHAQLGRRGHRLEERRRSLLAEEMVCALDFVGLRRATQQQPEDGVRRQGSHAQQTAERRRLNAECRRTNAKSTSFSSVLVEALVALPAATMQRSRGRGRYSDRPSPRAAR